MMGRLEAQENLFYRFRIEDHVPKDHLLRKIDWLLDFDDMRHELADLYSHTGRPSVDPELMLRMLLVGYLYGIRFERRLVEEVHLNLAYRWFCKLGLEVRVPDRSTFSKNRHGRFADGDVMRRLFESVVEKCVAFGFVGSTDAAVDGSTIEADANRDRKGTPHEVEKIWSRKEQVQRSVAEFLAKLAEDDVPAQPGPKHKPPKYISETDPDAAWSLKDGPGRFSYETNYMIDTDHGIIVDVEATPARLSQEIVAAKKMLERSAKRHDFQPDRITADGSYGTGPFLAWLLNREVTPNIPVLDRKHQTKGKYDLSHFQYDAQRDTYTCLEGHEMPLRRIKEDARVKAYYASKETCGACPIRKACTDAPFRTVTRHMDEEARQTVRDLRDTPAYEVSRRRRKKVEMLFAHLKRHLGLRRLRLIRKPTMISPAGNFKFYVASKPVDFRKGMDGLAAIVQNEFDLDPFNGAIFIFRSKRADRLKLIVWDGTGLVMTYKRIEGKGFEWPRIQDGMINMNKSQFEALFEGLDWKRVTARGMRRPVAV